MKTITDIIEKLFPVVNVTAVKATIDGAVYRYKKPDNSELRDIVIGSLSISNDEDPITQSATVNINCYAKNHPNGMPDDAHITTTLAAVITALEAYTGGTSVYFEFVMQNQNIFPDIDNPIMSYGNLRVKCTIEN